VCGVPGNLAALNAAAAFVRECGLLPLRVAKTAVPGSYGGVRQVVRASSVARGARSSSAPTCS
jgi:hypothetical protein